MGKIYVIGSQKGGVGKTTSTLNLAYALQKQGKKLLAVDFDSQTNLTHLSICSLQEKQVVTMKLDQSKVHWCCEQAEAKA